MVRPLGRAVDALLEASVAGSFSRLGPVVRSSLLGWEDPPPAALRDRVCVVTGATSGIGAALATGMARLGAEVHLVGRDEEKLRSSIERTTEQVPGARLTPHRADLGRLADVNDLAERLAEHTERIDVLAHVAGALVHEEQRTPDGLELTFQVHVVAPFLLTSRLLTQLSASGGGRVLTMSSGGMYTQRLDVAELLDPPHPFDGTRAYARAKRAQVVLNEEWARRHPRLGVGFHALHPGWVDTPGLSEGLPGFATRIRAALRTPEQGADTALWLSWTPDARPPGGHFWHDRRRRHTVVAPWTRTPPGEADRLWETVSRLADGPEDAPT